MTRERTKRVLRALLSLIGLGFLLSGRDSKPDHSGVLAQLRQHGFFAHFTDAESESLAALVKDRGWNAIHDENPRFFWADTKDGWYGQPH